MAELAGKAALVTGGSRGLGAATARILAEMGAAVYRSTHIHPRGRCDARPLRRLAAPTSP